MGVRAVQNIHNNAIQLFIDSFYFQVYIVDIYLGQFWRDPRFALGIDQNFTIGDELVHRIWTPDTFVVNAVKTQVHRLTKENQKIFMNLTDGFIMHVSRLDFLKSHFFQC